MREIDIEWVQLGIKVTAQLDADTQNPVLASLLWSKLPYNSLQNHALVSGNHLYHLVPIPELVSTVAEAKEDRTKSPDGTVFLSQLRHLAIKYGPLTEYIPAAPVGHVRPEHLPLLREAGRACWQAAYLTKTPIEVRVTRHGESQATYRLPPPPVVQSPKVQDLIMNIHAATQNIWIDPPSELLAIHEGHIKSRAGSYDQYLSTLVFVNGETRPLGYCALDGLVRAAQQQEFSLEHLKWLTPNFVRVPAEFLGYCGLDTLWEFTQQLLGVLDILQSKDEYLALISTLALYANCLNTWNLHLFPWHLGEAYHYREDACLLQSKSV